MVNILVSACLLGVNCKYNGNNNYNEDVLKLKKYFKAPLDTGKKEIIIKASFGNGRQTRPAKRFNVRPYMTGSVTSGARLMIGGLHDEHLSSYRFR